MACIETDGNWTLGKWGPPLFKGISLLSSVISISSYLQSYFFYSYFSHPHSQNPYHSINLPQAINCVLLKKEFPSGLMVRIPGSHCYGLRSILGQWTEIPQATCVAKKHTTIFCLIYSVCIMSSSRSGISLLG